MKHAAEVAFLFDVDDTLLDNDRFESDLRAWLDVELGAGSSDAYWKAFETQRAERDYADFIGALQRCFEASGRDPRWLRAGDYLLDYPFHRRLYPEALEVLERAQTLGPTWIITDGDGVMQPRKLRRSGIWKAVSGHVRIYVHKEHHLADIESICPAEHYVFVDDKLRILNAVKADWQARVTTVQPRQGHYARQSAEDTQQPADLTMEAIAALAAKLRREGAAAFVKSRRELIDEIGNGHKA